MPRSDLTLQRGGDREIAARLLPDSVFELPDAEGGEQEGLGSGEGAGGGHGVFAIAMAVGAVAWSAWFFAG